jgi:hypothetical protein
MAPLLILKTIKNKPVINALNKLGLPALLVYGLHKKIKLIYLRNTMSITVKKYQIQDCNN